MKLGVPRETFPGERRVAIVTLVQHLVQREKGPDGKGTGAPRIALNVDDEITREILVTNDGQVVHPRVLQLQEAR